MLYSIPRYHQCQPWRSEGREDQDTAPRSAGQSRMAGDKCSPLNIDLTCLQVRPGCVLQYVDSCMRPGMQGWLVAGGKSLDRRYGARSGQLRPAKHPHHSVPDHGNTRKLGAERELKSKWFTKQNKRIVCAILSAGGEPWLSAVQQAAGRELRQAVPALPRPGGPGQHLCCLAHHGLHGGI